MALGDFVQRRVLCLRLLAGLVIISSMGFAQRPEIEQQAFVKEHGRLSDAPRGMIEVLDNGSTHGEPIILLPSLGRGAEDFNDLRRRGLSRAAAATPRNRPVGSSGGAANIGRACR